MGSREQMIQLAIADLESGKITSERAAAAAYGIPRATLRDRRAGRVNRRAGHEQQQRLAPPQEKFLADWIIEQHQQGYPPSPARAREMASRILSMNGDNIPLGKAWLPKFIQRNPRVASCLGRRIEASHVSNA